MSYNLITSPWIEVTRASGTTHFITPAQITDAHDHDPVIALNYPRADWNAAVTEFLIGLLYVALQPRGLEDWAKAFITPPPTNILQKALEPLAPHFNFDGDGPRAFQDTDLLADQKPKSIDGLLIDAPGENTESQNNDLFIKRSREFALCLPYAVAALITLQTYSPSGGAGHRTSLRGGGPLTTFVVPRCRQRKKNQDPLSLWDRVWANVPEAADQTDMADFRAFFPWLSPTRTSEKDQIVTQADSHPALAFFACPRRIRLDFSADAVCSISGKSGPAASALRTQNYGAWYQHWQHPLSPYRTDKKQGLLPVHPHAGPSHYGDWLAWWGMGEGRPAKCQELWEKRRKLVGVKVEEPTAIEAVGFDIDKAKARQWVQTSVPWVPLHNENAAAFQDAVNMLIDAADKAAKAINGNAKIALFGIKKDDIYRLPESLSMDAMRTPGECLWSDSEARFRGLLQDILARLESDEWAPTTDLYETWLRYLRDLSLRIFDDTIDMDGLTATMYQRALWARHRLSHEFSQLPKASVAAALKLTSPPPKGKRKETAA